MLIQKQINKLDLKKIKNRHYNLTKKFIIPKNSPISLLFTSKIDGIEIQLPINVNNNQSFYLTNINVNNLNFNVDYGNGKNIFLTPNKPLIFLFNGNEWVILDKLKNIEIPIFVEQELDVNLGSNEVIENVVLPKLIEDNIPKSVDVEKYRFSLNKNEITFKLNLRERTIGGSQYYNTFDDKLLFNKNSIFSDNSYLQLKIYLDNNVNRVNLIGTKEFYLNPNIVGDEIIFKCNKPNTMNLNLNSNEYYFYHFIDDFKNGVNTIKLYVTCTFFNAKTGKSILLVNNQNGDLFNEFGVIDKNNLFNEVILNKISRVYNFNFVEVENIINLYEVE